ncbi:MAG: UDP-glucose 4-epimerase GalE [Planctomycetaceae bacterium]|nr:UDP-glucose 4-epimerase GalE [Planctomycetaceae bacterium]
MKVLVTGGAGYIGSVAVERLIASGESVVVFDNLSQGHREAIHSDAELVRGDLAAAADIEAAFARHKPDAVMHFASNLLVGESMEKPFKYLGDNVSNGVNLLKCATAHGVERFILSSTANLFDEPETIPISESECIVPGSPYGESKYILERMLAWLERTHGLRYAALRYFNAAGATSERGEDHDPELHLIPLVLQVAQRKREHISIFGDDYDTPDGTCVRDYIHVSDLADAHILALHALSDGSRTYNLGNGQGFSVKEVIETSREITGHGIASKTTPRRPGDPAKLVADSSKIRAELGWEPKYPDLRQIIEMAWSWHSKHPNGYGS